MLVVDRISLSIIISFVKGSLLFIMGSFVSSVFSVIPINGLFNSAISNYKNGNIRSFNMKFMSKKKPTEYLHFEDCRYPSFIRDIKSNYWFTSKDRKREDIIL